MSTIGIPGAGWSIRTQPFKYNPQPIRREADCKCIIEALNKLIEKPQIGFGIRHKLKDFEDRVSGDRGVFELFLEDGRQVKLAVQIYGHKPLPSRERLKIIRENLKLHCWRTVFISVYQRTENIVKSIALTLKVYLCSRCGRLNHRQSRGKENRVERRHIKYRNRLACYESRMHCFG